mgnify:CR=1 FL=1
MIIELAANSNLCRIGTGIPGGTRRSEVRSREEATRRWIRNLVSQLLEHLPCPAVLTSPGLERIICANADAAAWLLPRAARGSGSHLGHAICMDAGVRELSRTEPGLLPVRTIALINGRSVRCRIHAINTGAGSERLRLLCWDV